MYSDKKSITQDIYDLIFLIFISRNLQLSSIVRISFLCPVPNQVQSREVSPCNPLTGPCAVNRHGTYKRKELRACPHEYTPRCAWMQNCTLIYAYIYLMTHSCPFREIYVITCSNVKTMIFYNLHYHLI